ncbi:hypothetical protein CXB49_11265 [Chromobacterium sp. ATCC 53434]|uniref:DUF1843 domain-containing protein n=1 Tax=Chromobacterium TaxID=535 RepID=UPI000C77A89F|nr:DUF1843 domain-containing protein [Chromobacterium sp. ATCC 53434]AUH51352.1 hypothetical protein CXB49_11265 [Chromobacterium sp. ATCC 53434]
MSQEQTHIIPPYGVAIQQALDKGELPQMQKLLEESRQYHSELGHKIAQLEQEIAKRRQR